MSLTEVSVAVMATAGFLLLGIGVLSVLRHEKKSVFATCVMILAGAALLAVVAGAQFRARTDIQERPHIRYDPKRYPAKPYPRPELFRSERGKFPKQQKI